MKEISLHIMDIVQNSITANATLIEIVLDIQQQKNELSVSIKDNGKGMSAEMVANVTSPFVTTRTTRKVGLGISLFKAGAENTGGNFVITSELGKGTEVKASYQLNHLDRPPIGDFSGTMQTIIICNPNIDFVVGVVKDNERDFLDTRDIREVLGDDVPLDLPEVSNWVKAQLDELFPAEYKML